MFCSTFPFAIPCPLGKNYLIKTLQILCKTLQFWNKTLLLHHDASKLCRNRQHCLYSKGSKFVYSNHPSSICHTLSILSSTSSSGRLLTSLAGMYTWIINMSTIYTAFLSLRLLPIFTIHFVCSHNCSHFLNRICHYTYIYLTAVEKLYDPDNPRKWEQF